MTDEEWERLKDFEEILAVCFYVWNIAETNI
jgi:hypothetical protein